MRRLLAASLQGSNLWALGVAVWRQKSAESAEFARNKQNPSLTASQGKQAAAADFLSLNLHSGSRKRRAALLTLIEEQLFRPLPAV